MEFATWVRTNLWRSSDWPAALFALHGTTVGRPSPQTAQRLWDLACATEHCDPDRGRALAMFVDAWRAGHREALPRAKALARTLRAHLTLATLALDEGDLLAAGAAYLDAGLPELARDPLVRFIEGRGAAGAPSPLALDDAKALLALAKGTRFDAKHAIADNLAVAMTVRDAAAVERYVHAARIARVAGLSEQLTGVIAAAVRACPGDSTIAALLETQLLDRNDATDLVEHYRTRFEASGGRAEYVARMCAAARELIPRDGQRGLGLRLLRLSLEASYDALLPEIPSHLALWALMVTHARAHGTTRELLPLLVRALAAPLSEDDALYLSALGLAITWRDLGDTLAAQPYAATVLDFAADHPLAHELMREVAASAVEAKPALPAFATDLPSPAAACSPEPAAPPRANPYADDRQVKRGAAGAARPAYKVSSRLELLKPPPPRSTTLKRDTSPFPLAPAAPPTGPLRAPRVVLPVDVVIELPTGAFFSTVLRDISTSGAFVVTKRKLDVGTTVALALVIPERDSLRQSRHEANARIARQSDTGYGLAFIDPSAALLAALRAATE